MPAERQASAFKDPVVAAETGPMHRSLLSAALMLSLWLAASPRAVAGGAACVMAKWQGNTLAYVLVTGKGHPDDAQEAARARLREQGYGNYGAGVDVTHPQGLTNLDHGFAVVVRADYKTWRGKDRTSYGCGFSGTSYQDALWDAMRDMQRFSWGWVPDRDGYEVVEKQRF